MNILITGVNPIQCGRGNTELEIVTNVTVLVESLTALGHKVENRPVVPGEDLDAYDRVILYLAPAQGFVSKHVFGALWTYHARPDVIGAVDDWQTRKMLADLRNTSTNADKRLWDPRLRRANYDEARQQEGAILEALRKIAFEPWHFPVLAPTHGDGGDLGLLGLPTERVIPFDPTCRARRYVGGLFTDKRPTWVMASLVNKESWLRRQALTWPVSAFGNRKLGQPRVKEANLFQVCQESWGMLSPRHNNAGSGWWRYRFIMSRDAGSVLVCDEAEGTVIGRPYVVTARVVETANDGERERLAAEQRDALDAVTWTPDRLDRQLSAVMTA